mgnify:CR=1 FL=1
MAITAAELQQQITITLTGKRRFVNSDAPSLVFEANPLESGKTLVARACLTFLDTDEAFTVNDIKPMVPAIPGKRTWEYLDRLRKLGGVKAVGAEWQGKRLVRIFRAQPHLETIIATAAPGVPS